MGHRTSRRGAVDPGHVDLEQERLRAALLAQPLAVHTTSAKREDGSSRGTATGTSRIGRWTGSETTASTAAASAPGKDGTPCASGRRESRPKFEFDINMHGIGIVAVTRRVCA